MPDKVALELASQISRQNVSKEGWTTYYVDDTNGNDGANGLTWESAFKTIQHAVDTAECWAKIYIKAGTYTEAVNITTSEITLIGESKSTTTIINGSSVPLTITANRCHIKELALDSGTETNTLAINGDYSIIINCIITGNRLAIGGDYNEISNCIANANGFYFAGNHNILHDCSSDGSGTYGILLRGDSKYNQIFNNNIWNAADTGIHLDLVGIGPSYTSIYHNNFIGNATQVSDEGTNNTWIENYYDDHTMDTNKDGICDTSYTFATGGTDYTPVSRRNGWNQVSLGMTTIANIDNDYSTSGSLDFTTEQTVFEITDDTRYKLLSPWIDLTPFTAGDVVTIQMYRSVAAAGATYRKAGSPVTFTVGTDNPIVELSDIAHYGYIKVVASSSPGRTVDVPFGYIKKAME